ncbi:MAG: hypothetical protein DWP95_03375 [Proteobacteria bacterium]|nr:MAG: hypothetical protein DWP95_03375 [Pseudomonadota bacterium]
MKAWFRNVFKKVQTPAYYFAHIPKTAGTSFIVLLDRYFPDSVIMPEQLWRQVGRISDVKAQDYQLIRGHFGGGGAIMLTDRPVKHFTMLRDPVELSYSTYEFIKREQNTVVHELVVGEQLSFEDFLNHPDTQNLVQNRMVRYLSFDFNDDPSAQEVFLSPQTVQSIQGLLKPSGQTLNNEERFNRAKNWLDKALWFGVLDRFDEAMQLLCYRMKWPPIGASQKLNKHHKRPVISELARQRVLQNNREDSRLYDYAQHQFAHQYRAMLTALGCNELSSSSDINAALDQHYQNAYAEQHKSLQAVEFDCGQILLGQNWHRREWLDQEQAYFRWSGPATVSSLDFWLEPYDYSIEITIINALSDSFLDDLTVQVNGHTVAWSSDDVGVVRTLRLICPKNSLRDNGLLRLSFECADVLPHAEAFASDDLRKVGFALKNIVIKR